MMIAGLYCWKKTSPLFANLGYESSCWSYQGYINRHQTTLYAEKEWIGRYGESFFPHLLIACKVRNFLLLANGKRRKKMLKPDCKLSLARFGEFTKPAVCMFMGEMQLIFFIFFPPCFHRFSTDYLIVFHHAFGNERSICTWKHTRCKKGDPFGPPSLQVYYARCTFYRTTLYTIPSIITIYGPACTGIA